MDDYCPPVCSCYNSVVQCSNKSVGRVPYGIPYGTRQILLMNNYIKGIQLDLFAKYNSMEVLVLSNNWLTDGAIKGAFSQIPALKHLYLDGNRLKSVPTDLPVSLEELRLDNNYLRAISEGAWSRCPGLFILRLSNNNLGPGSIPDAALSSLRNLHTLSLDHNQLTSIPLGLPLLIKELYLKGNLIEQVREDAFHKMWALEVLDLSANRLTNAGLRNSLNATRLESLSLEGNRLEHVPRHLPPSLKSLNLEGNFISSIKKADFSRLKELELLGLARNKIFEVAPGAFRELAALHRLDLCHNALQQVPRQLPRGLHSVALTDNRIQSVPHDAFCWGDRTRSVRGFVRVHLEHNLIDVGKMDVRSFRCLQGFQLVHSY
ncbi:asporin [Salarias fasciatus]|uniref:asporin n=1 Tax=Salarias fasciatus TaxID=181472 RepID=UPI001176FAA7|nr:asporin-like [Salarias fasciatus]